MNSEKYWIFENNIHKIKKIYTRYLRSLSQMANYLNLIYHITGGKTDGQALLLNQ